MLDVLEKRVHRIWPSAGVDLSGLRASASLPRTLRRKSDVYIEGDSTAGAHVLIDGVLCRYKTDLHGQRRVVSLMIPGDVFGLESLYGMEADYGVSALGDAVVTQVPHDRLRGLLQSSPDLHMIFWHLFATDLRISREWIVRLGSSAQVRLAHLICEFATRFALVRLPLRAAFPWPLSQVDLSDILAITSIHVNRVLQDMRRNGLIEVKDHTLRVLDWERLAIIANFDGTYLHGSMLPRAASRMG